MLFNLAVPAIALAGAVLEAQPVAAAHGVARHPRSAHHKLAERHVPRNAVGAKHKREYQILTRGDGSKCRVRPSTGQQPSSGGNTAGQQPSTDGNPTEQPQLAAGGNTSESQPAPGSTTTSATPSPTDSPDTPDSPDRDDSPDSPDPGANNTQTPPPSSGGGQGSVNGGSINVGSKVGAAWPNGDFTPPDQPGWIGNFVGSKTSWYYSWSPHSCKQNDDLGLEFVPMLWGAKQVSDWHAAADSWPSSVKNALFINEPNQHDQAGIDIYGALPLWINDFLPKSRARGLRIGSAAPTSAPDGVEWVVNFYKYCMEQNGNDDAKCKADFAPVHYYDVDVTAFQNYLVNFHQQVGVNLWVTEYACQNFNGGAQCDDGQTWDFHQKMAAYMDGQDWIERYAPFGMMRNMQGVEQNNALMDPNGQVTALGKFYADGA